MILKEYLCDCNACRTFDFENCEKEATENEIQDLEIEDCYLADEENECNEEQIFDFVDIPSFVTLLTGAIVEPLYFLKIIHKGITDETLFDNWGHIVSPGSMYFTGHYLKIVRSRNISYKKFEMLPLIVYITPDEIHDNYVEINDDMLLSTDIYNALIQKAKH